MSLLTYKGIYRIISIVMCAFVMLFMLGGTSVNTSADEKKGSLTLICKRDDKILTGMKWQIFRVGERKGQNYVLNKDFRRYPVSLADKSADGLSKAAATLENYAVIDRRKNDGEGVIDKNGYLVFPQLRPGLYMVCGKNFYVNETVYVPSAVLVEINPSFGNDGIDLMVYPKVVYKILAETSRSHTVKKVWTDSGQLHPAIQVDIYKDGELDDTIVLDDSNKWTYSWYADDFAEWRVMETEVPTGYSVAYRFGDGQYVIENTYGLDYSEETQPPTELTTQMQTEFSTQPSTQPIPPQTSSNSSMQSQSPPPPQNTVTATGGYVKLPQTGQLWWPVPVMACGGIVMIIVGLRLKSGNKSE